ncbi:MAG: hypothetical protein KIS72_03620 [Luteimonas sp.]|nr:hypothetical protein [Luteimonas sp.]
MSHQRASPTNVGKPATRRWQREAAGITLPTCASPGAMAGVRHASLRAELPVPAQFFLQPRIVAAGGGEFVQVVADARVMLAMARWRDGARRTASRRTGSPGQVAAARSIAGQPGRGRALVQNGK